jgi:hypothetical protein
MRPRHGPEFKIQQTLIDFLTKRGWLVERLIGNAFQQGIPDLYCYHPKWGERWVDVKVKGHYSFTRAQKHKWPKWAKFGVGVWILTGVEDYDLLFQPPNWKDYWKDSWGQIDVEALLDDITETT